MSILAENLKMLREAVGLSQAQFAEIMLMDRSTYAYYETGKSRPDVDLLVRFSKAYRVSTDCLLGIDPEGLLPIIRDTDPIYSGKLEKLGMTVEEKKMLMRYRLLAEEDRHRIDCQIEQAYVENKKRGANN